MIRQLARAHAPALVIALGAFVLMLAIAYGVFRAHPFCLDEYGYVYQAEIFADGKTHLETPAPALAPLRELYMVWHDGKVFSKYPPGFSMVLSLGVHIGAPAAINPLLAAITLLLLYLAVLRLVGRPYALVAQLILATNPFFLGYSASLFAHTLTLLFAMVVVVVLTTPGEPGPRRWLALGGVLGAFVWVRPVDALCASLFVAFTVVRQIGWKRSLIAGAIALAPFVALVLALMAYNHALSGRFALSTYPVLDAEFRLNAGDHLGPLDNALQIADEYVRRLVTQGEVLWGRYFIWPAGVIVPVLALSAVLLRAGERSWRIALAFHFLVIVLLYNFHGMTSPIPTWPQYGARYWFSGFGAVVLLATMGLSNLAIRAQASPRTQRFATARNGRIAIAVIVVVQLAIGVGLFRDYAYRHAVVAAIERDIEVSCPGRRVVALDLPLRPQLPAFVRAADFRRNPFFSGERLYVIGRTVEPAMLRALPGYTACRYDFARWDAAR